MSLLGILGLQITNAIAVLQRVARAIHSCINNEDVEEIIGIGSNGSDESLECQNEIGLNVDCKDCKD